MASIIIVDFSTFSSHSSSNERPKVATGMDDRFCNFGFVCFRNHDVHKENSELVFRTGISDSLHVSRYLAYDLDIF